MTTPTPSPEPPQPPAVLPDALAQKQAALLEQLRRAGRVMVAFSGGVDSSYLAWAANEALGRNALAVTAVSPSYPASHRSVATEVLTTVVTAPGSPTELETVDRTAGSRPIPNSARRAA